MGSLGAGCTLDHHDVDKDRADPVAAELAKLALLRSSREIAVLEAIEMGKRRSEGRSQTERAREMG